jgi:Ni,Fe-hydrogenase III component G
MTERTTEKQVVTPDISQDLDQYRQLVNADTNPYANRAIQAELNEIYFDENREPRTEKEIAMRLAVYQASIKARIDQLLGMDPGSFDHRQVKSQEEFEASPRTGLKLAQELFSSPADYQSVKRTEIALGAEADLFWDMVMDPSKITETVLKDMGLDELVPKNLEAHSAEEQGRKKRRLSPQVKTELLAESIGYVKHFFANCMEPLAIGNEDSRSRTDKAYFRLFRITEGPNVGMILGTQAEGDKKTLFLTDLASAGRRLDHIVDDSYGKEIAKLKKIEITLEEMTRKIETGDWEEIKSSGELERMQAKIAVMVDGLKFVRNDQKQEILFRVTRCVSFKDSKDRLNPSSRMAIWNSTQRFISERIGEIEGISGYLAKDRVRVTSHMREEAERLNGFYSTVNENTDRLKILDVNVPLDETAVARITTNLQSLIASCEAFKFEPYLSLAAKMIAEINAIIEILNSPDHDEKTKREQARYSFVKIYSIAKLLNVEDELISTRDEWLRPGYNPEHVYSKGLMERLLGIRERFMSKKVAQDVEMKDLSPIYGEIYKFLGQAITSLGQALGRGKTSKDRIEAVKAVDKMLKDFSVAKLLRSKGDLFLAK